MEDYIPNFLLNQYCTCGSGINIKYVSEVGFYRHKKRNGQLFFKYYCPDCAHTGTVEFGDKDWNLKKLCLLILDELKNMTDGEKIAMKRKSMFND